METCEMKYFTDEMAELEAGLSKRRIEEMRLAGHAARLARARDGLRLKKQTEAKPQTIKRQPVRD